MHPTGPSPSPRSGHAPLAPVSSDVGTPSPQELGALDLDAFLVDPARKQAFVTPMFEHIAPRYDAFTRLFSFGMDARWKRELMTWFDARAPQGRQGPQGPQGCDVLDVACGTGDLALAAAALRPAAKVRGVDAAAGMIALAEQRVTGADTGRVHFATGDLTRLALGDASVDVVLAGYALRNVPRYEDGLAELHRVLRPGGVLLTLDFYRPVLPLWRELFLGYLHVSGSVVGWWWHRSPVIYNYIAHSIRHFTTADAFSVSLQQAGFAPGRRRDYLLGGIALHEAVRR
jgi:demethylmenaquinone methyltransferase / 2-methoxy-6-polyprenyl-1,4-benzoquinol methylase